MSSRCINLWQAAILVKLLLLTTSLYASVNLRVEKVTHEPARFLPVKNESVKIGYTVSKPCKVTVYIFDARELLIREIAQVKHEKKGRYFAEWNGRDQEGKVVPPEAYHYTIRAFDGEGKEVEHDITDYTGGEPVEVKDLQWDAQSKKLTYRLQKTARLSIKIGKKNNGPLLKVIYDWVPRLPGFNEETWDGKDQSRVMDLSNTQNLDITAAAYKLSKNTIIVGEKQKEIQLIDNMPWGETKRIKKKKIQKKMYRYGQQPIESRRNLEVFLKLHEVNAKTQDGLPILKGIVPVQLDVIEKDRVIAINRRIEPSFFVDDELTFENEVGFLPMTWQFDTKKVAEGVHYITVNLLGYEGNIGIATLKVYVKH